MYKLPKEYYVLDFETNGLPKADDVKDVDIIEVGWLLVKDSSIIVKSAESLAKPVLSDGTQIPLTKKIVEITKITDDMLKNAAPSVEVANELLKDVVHSDLSIVGHNIVGFDRLFINKYCDILGWTRPKESRYIDSAALFKTYRRAHRNKTDVFDLPKNELDAFTWAKNVLNKSWVEDGVKYNLDAAVRYLTIPNWDIQFARHRALYDCVLTKKVLEALKTEMSL